MVYAPDAGHSSMRFCTRMDPDASKTVTVTGDGFFKLRAAAIAAVAMASAADSVNVDVERSMIYCLRAVSDHKHVSRKTSGSSSVA